MSELRPRAVTPPTGAPQIPSNMLPGENRPPLPVGQVMLTPHTRENLLKLGWRDGDPIPGDFGARVSETVEQINKERETATFDEDTVRNWKPLVAKTVDISTLPEEKQQELRQYLAEYKQATVETQKIAEGRKAVEAQIPESVQGEARDVMVQQILEGQAAAAMHAAKKATVAADPAPVVETAVPPATGVQDGPTNCPRCTWPLKVPFTVEPTPEDKQNFLVALLGDQNFQKEYTGLGGTLRTTFRSLTYDDTEQIQREIGKLVREGRIRGDAEFLLVLREYRFVLALTKIVTGGHPKYIAKPFATWQPPADTPDDERIAAYRTAIIAELKMTEPFRVILGKLHAEFQRLVELLEEQVSDTDFWQGIELPR